MLSRRELIKLGLYGSTALLHLVPGASGSLVWALEEEALAKKKKKHKQPPPPPPFACILPLPPVAQPVNPLTLNPAPPLYNDGIKTTYYEISMAQGAWQAMPTGAPTAFWGYDPPPSGQSAAAARGYLGPTLVAAIGERVVARFHNNLPGANADAIIHHHGAHTPGLWDGSALWSQQIAQGGFKDYVYPNDDDVSATHWYHDHNIDFTGHNVFMGLEGCFLLYDQVELGLNLPGNPTDPVPAGLAGLVMSSYDLPIVVQDRTFDLNNQLVYNPFNHDGFIGDMFLVNGAIMPAAPVSSRKYRLRLLNGSNSRFYQLSLVTANGLANPLPLHVIGSDGGLLAATTTQASVKIAPAERVEVIVDFSGLALNTQVYLVNTLAQTGGRGPDGLAPVSIGVPGIDGVGSMMRFNVVDTTAADHSSLPQTLRTDLPVFDPAVSVITRNWLFNRSQGAWQINNQFFDPGPPPPAPEAPRIDAKVSVGTTEIWSLKNGGGGWYHPVHIHRNQFRILDRNGQPPLPQENGLKDVFVLNPGDTVRVITKYTGTAQVGNYVMHCHNVEHEDMRMMIVFNVSV